MRPGSPETTNAASASRRTSSSSSGRTVTPRRRRRVGRRRRKGRPFITDSLSGRVHLHAVSAVLLRSIEHGIGGGDGGAGVATGTHPDAETDGEVKIGSDLGSNGCQVEALHGHAQPLGDLVRLLRDSRMEDDQKLLAADASDLIVRAERETAGAGDALRETFTAAP